MSVKTLTSNRGVHTHSHRGAEQGIRGKVAVGRSVNLSKVAEDGRAFKGLEAQQREFQPLPTPTGETMAHSSAFQNLHESGLPPLRRTVAAVTTHIHPRLFSRDLGPITTGTARGSRPSTHSMVDLLPSTHRVSGRHRGVSVSWQSGPVTRGADVARGHTGKWFAPPAPFRASVDFHQAGTFP